MPKVTAVIRRPKKNGKGECPVWVRIADRDTTRYVATGVWVKPADWNKKKQQVRSTDTLDEEKNGVIRDRVDEIERERLRLILKDEGPATPERIKLAVTKDATPDFFKFAEGHLADLESRGNIARHRRLKATLGKLAAFTGKPLRFDRITPRLLTDFETDCLTRLENKQSTVETNLKDLRAIINRAVAHRAIDAKLNPFGKGGFKITKGEAADRTRLSFAEITRIQNLEIERDSLAWHARNMWLFAFFTGGVRFGDVVQMTAGRLVAGTNGAPDRLAYRMGKNGKLQSVKITPPARRIIEEYISDDSDPNDFVFPFLRDYDLSTPRKLHNAVASRNTVVNRLLKDIGEAAQINEPITTHVARHSFADAARTNGWSIYDISKALQHASVKQTEAYLAAFDADALDGKMDDLFGEVGS